MKRELQLNSCVKSETFYICVAMTVILSCACVAVSATNSGKPLRLALLSSEAIHKSGLSDLMIVQMQELPNVELVERELLNKVFNEMALSMMLGADQSENRRKAGTLLKADMLVLLSIDTGEGGIETVKVVISECSNGARLRVAWIPFTSDDLEKVSSDLVEIANRTLEQFKSGVKQVIGVSHFVSKNLIHDYDHLQAGYVYLLQNALSSSPGIAVIEVEEARSIARENELAGDMKLNRMVPLFVEGEFRVEHGKSEKQAKVVNLKIRISDSAKLTKQIEREDLAFDKLATFITDDVALEILKLSKSPSVKILDRDTQLQALIKNADEFARVGAWKHAADLREAAVLLKPDYLEQRIKLINEHYGAKRSRIYGYSLGKTRNYRWRSDFQHLEYMIYNRLISMYQAVGLSSQTLYGLPTSAKQYKRDFLLAVYPKILDLEPMNSDPNNRKKERGAWYNTLVHQVEYARWVGCPTKDDLELYLQIHDNLPDDMGSSRRFVLFLKDHAKPSWRRRRRGTPYPDEYFTEQEFLDFITAMSRSSKPLSSFYGRYALLLYEYHLRRKQMKTVGDLYDEVEQLANEVKEHKFSISQIFWPCKSNCLYEEIINLLQEIEQCMQKEEKTMSTSKAP